MFILILIVDASCPLPKPQTVCAIKGSSQVLSFIMEKSMYFRPIEETTSRHRLSNYTIHVKIKINNVTFQDEGNYGMYTFYVPTVIVLHVSSKYLYYWLVFHTHTSSICYPSIAFVWCRYDHITTWKKYDVNIII